MCSKFVGQKQHSVTLLCEPRVEVKGLIIVSDDSRMNMTCHDQDGGTGLCPEMRSAF